MRIIFFGSSEFAVPVLEALFRREEVALVVTQPDKKKGRSLRPCPTPIKRAAEDLNIRVLQAERLDSDETVRYLAGLASDIFVVVSFGQILNKKLLEIPRLYPLNVHASLLPEYRGAAPISWALANGEKETGVTIIRMNEKMDEGDIMLSESISIGSDDDAVELSGRLSQKGSDLLLKAIELIKTDEISFMPQDSSLATYAPRLKKEDGLIDWRWTAKKIYDRIRAFVPWPVCYTYWNERALKIWRAAPEGIGQYLKPGTILETNKKGLLVGTGEGNLRIKELQLEGGRRMAADEFIKGHRELRPGANFKFS